MKFLIAFVIGAPLAFVWGEMRPRDLPLEQQVVVALIAGAVLVALFRVADLIADRIP